MAALCSLSAFAAGVRQPVVLDARLLLRPMGLPLATALSLVCEVWFSREFMSLISFNADDVTPPPFAGLHDDEVGNHERIGEGLEIWQAAYANGVVHGAFQWIGDNPQESPGRAASKPGIVSCFDALIHTLNPSFDLGWSPLVTCGLQSLALAASLAPAIPVILTSAGKGANAPALCRDAESAGVGQQHLPEGSMLSATLAASTIPALELAGLMDTQVAGVWLAAPRANLVNNPDFPGEYAPERYRLTVAECLPWQGSQTFWTNLNDGGTVAR
ncbi:MAG: hypothetical protein Q8L53_16220 [Aestuariivirga sp.]|nr:hypothetical protein [Aestuariivirga sp.]